MAKSVASSLVCPRLDYANSLVFGTIQKMSVGYSGSRTHLPELLPVMLSHETHIHQIRPLAEIAQSKYSFIYLKTYLLLLLLLPLALPPTGEKKRSRTGTSLLCW